MITLQQLRDANHLLAERETIVLRRHQVDVRSNLSVRIDDDPVDTDVLEEVRRFLADLYRQREAEIINQLRELGVDVAEIAD